MTHKYLRRARSDTKDSSFTGVYHLVQDDGTTSACNKVRVGVNNYQVIERQQPAYHSLTCVNCQRLARQATIDKRKTISNEQHDKLLSQSQEKHREIWDRLALGE
jgi:hypothetical protein